MANNAVTEKSIGDLMKLGGDLLPEHHRVSLTMRVGAKVTAASSHKWQMAITRPFATLASCGSQPSEDHAMTDRHHPS